MRTEIEFFQFVRIIHRTSILEKLIFETAEYILFTISKIGFVLNLN